ncbi:MULTISPECIES: dienelactone hydrolase family protein [Stenotrophomonas]|jgi:dienelactone hydrolase|uniref:dienelactone hydrolase family protein n=1 Tax=Stenotrophomonas TaxID=40323 RepID=UPI000BDD276A|nr:MULTISPECIES: dienelactone hydrolase family protein [Stenotrophomonas]MCA7024246.1 dienelactone hydrolase family protein [Stenotrophomonas acidaminiphila]MCE4075821.1 dienelactone hydrolase family protein [Stenotrophomonas acidaminiphila]OZB52841.1 MAG: dienelactone hydrolase [Stenotrophomonas sp. 14-69-23]
MRTMRKWQVALLVACVSAAMPALAKLQQRPVEWQLDGTRYSGVLVFDDEGDGRRPGVVMVPNWRGVNASAIEKAGRIAGDDYVVLVADVYGSAVRPKDDAEAAAASRPLRENRAVLRARARAALDALKAQAGKAPLDASRIAAVGFCFGGSTVLEMARAGMPLAGVVSLHGGLSTPSPAAAGSAKVPMLVLNGAADRGVTAEDIAAFGKEMDGAGADWQFVNFSGAVHCFAESDANSPPGCLYDPRAARRAWKMMDDFLEERLQR